MNSKTTITLALVAGFAGGLASRSFELIPVKASGPEIPQVIRAHEFVVLDKTDTGRLAIGVEYDGKPSIEILKPNGKVQTVRFNHGPYVGGGPKKPTLLPLQP